MCGEAGCQAGCEPNATLLPLECTATPADLGLKVVIIGCFSACLDAAFSLYQHRPQSLALTPRVCGEAGCEPFATPLPLECTATPTGLGVW